MNSSYCCIVIGVHDIVCNLTNVAIDILHSCLQRQAVYKRVSTANGSVSSQHTERACLAGAVGAEKTEAFPALHTYNTDII